MLNASVIPSARVPLIDERTGLVSREWFAYFQNLFYLTGSGGNDTTLTEVQYPPAPDVAEFLSAQPADVQALAPNPFEVAPVLDPSIGLSVETLQSLLAATEAAAVAPVSPSTGLLFVTSDTSLTGDGTPLSPLAVTYPLTAAPGTAAYANVVDFDPVAAPVTKVADFVVAATDKWLVNNKAASTCTVTLPAAASFPGRELTFQNYQAFTVVSASANVVPQGGGAAGTAILLDVVGNWATLVSNGTNWVIMQAAAYNNLLLE